MKYIQKKQAPSAFETWKKTYIAKNGNTLEDLYVQADMTGKKIWSALGTSKVMSNGELRIYSKEALKIELLEEQGSICCYCNRKIAYSDTTIEHFKPKGLFFSLAYDYNNLFASCDGFASVPKPRDICCNEKRLEKDLLALCPTDATIETHFAFTIDGQIEGLTNKGKEAIRMLGLDIKKIKSRKRSRD